MSFCWCQTSISWFAGLWGDGWDGWAWHDPGPRRPHRLQLWSKRQQNAPLACTKRFAWMLMNFHGMFVQKSCHMCRSYMPYEPKTLVAKPPTWTRSKNTSVQVRSIFHELTWHQIRLRVLGLLHILNNLHRIWKIWYTITAELTCCGVKS